MALQLHPNAGTLVRCTYEPGFKEPEMVKRRPVLIVSPRLEKRDGLCVVVPLSTTKPNKLMPYHYELKLEKPLPAPYDAEVHWIKADMVNTVGFHRLDAFAVRDGAGKRRYLYPSISKEELEAVRRCVMAGIGILT